MHLYINGTIYYADNESGFYFTVSLLHPGLGHMSRMQQTRHYPLFTSSVIYFIVPGHEKYFSVKVFVSKALRSGNISSL